MNFRFAPLLSLLLACNLWAQNSTGELEARVQEVLTTTPLIDGHNDIPWAYQMRVSGHIGQLDLSTDLSQLDYPTDTDLPRLARGQVGGQFWSVFTPVTQTGGDPGATSQVMTQIDLVKRLVAEHPQSLAMAYTAADVRDIHQQGKIASLIGIEGGHAIENSLGTLRGLFGAGARYMTLTHTKSLDWADSANDTERLDGLSPFGVEVVREMNRLGMLVDLSHVSVATMNDALDTSEAPVIFSHSNAYGVTPNVRNVSDEVLMRLKANGGVVMVTFFPGYVSTAADEDFKKRFKALIEARQKSGQPTDDASLIPVLMKDRSGVHATLAQVADHIDYIRDLIGVDHIGIGSDFDGMPPGPIGLEDASTYPALFVELLRRGYSDEDIAKIAGENILRVMTRAEMIAAALQRARPPSDALISELDPPLENASEKANQDG
ncbi:MAG: dipeptidase [Halioglobus sp.]